jgi:hypothetical protein
MIYIHPVGGLGNFLFHIAAIWSLAKDNNDDLCLLDVDAKIKIMKRDEIWNAPHADDYRFLFNRFPNKNGIVVQQLHYPFIYAPLVYRPEYEYCGYFQSEKNFNHRRNDILKLFGHPIEFEGRINKYSHLFGNISIHVRRGNYLYYPNIHPQQSMDYYNTAISMLPTDLKILIFSDDIPWCRENFIGDKFVFIDEIDYISLYVMSKMKYHIITNSSFSWWGAWLSVYDDKIVIAPKKWLGDGIEDTKDLIPDSWIKK